MFPSSPCCCVGKDGQSNYNARRLDDTRFVGTQVRVRGEKEDSSVLFYVVKKIRQLTFWFVPLYIESHQKRQT
jgi:hypothetical protein